MNQVRWSSELIRETRKKHKLTQEKLSKELGCRQQTISEWELGMYQPKNAYSKLLSMFFSQLEGTHQ